MVVATPQLKGCDGLQDPGGLGPQGSKKLTREREAYFLLMRQGVSELCGPIADLGERAAAGFGLTSPRRYGRPAVDGPAVLQ